MNFFKNGNISNSLSLYLVDKWGEKKKKCIHFEKRLQSNPCRFSMLKAEK